MSMLNEGDRVRLIDRAGMDAMIGETGVVIPNIEIVPAGEIFVEMDDTRGASRRLFHSLPSRWEIIPQAEEAAPFPEPEIAVVAAERWVRVNNERRSPYFARVLSIVGDSAWIDDGNGASAGLVVNTEHLEALA